MADIFCKNCGGKMRRVGNHRTCPTCRNTGFSEWLSSQDHDYDALTGPERSVWQSYSGMLPPKRTLPELDADLDIYFRTELEEEVIKLRNAIRKHRDSSGHDLCWSHPELWDLLPEKADVKIDVPPTCEFLERCKEYRASLEKKE